MAVSAADINLLIAPGWVDCDFELLKAAFFPPHWQTDNYCWRETHQCVFHGCSPQTSGFNCAVSQKCGESVTQREVYLEQPLQKPLPQSVSVCVCFFLWCCSGFLVSACRKKSEGCCHSELQPHTLRKEYTHIFIAQCVLWGKKTHLNIQRTQTQWIGVHTDRCQVKQWLTGHTKTYEMRM